MKKIWSNLSVTKKIFTIFALVFILFLAVWMAGQFFFFGQYYTYIKSKGLSKSVDSFCEEYAELEDSDEINRTIVKYSNSSDAYYAVMTQNGEMLYMLSYELVVAPDGGGENIRFTLDNAIHNEEFVSTEFIEGERIEVKYFALDHQMRKANFFFPIEIAYDGYVWRNIYRRGEQGFAPMPPEGRRTDFMFDDDDTASVSGRIVSVILPGKQNAKLSVQQNDAAMVMMDWISRLRSGESVEAGERINYILNASNSNAQYNIAIKKIKKGESYEFVLAILPMSNISDAVEAVKEFSWFLFVVMFILMGIIAAVFSRMITKPIIEVNNITKKMKKLDFSQKCRAASHDELGMLAQNVNEMSEKLDMTIKELTEANEELVKDIEHEKLLETQRKEFIAAASHELKTPLAIIRAYSEGLADGVFKSNYKRYLQIIVDETKKLDKLVLDMIENSRLEGGTMKINKKEHDLCQFAKKIAERFKEPCEAEGIKLETCICGSAVIKSFDRDLLEQVITNFITNAMKNTSDGIITVGVDENKLWVENEGRNIPEEELDRIWDRFYKADRSRERFDGGTGLGLSIAKNILVLHSAEFGAENVETGVKFWFSLK